MSHHDLANIIQGVWGIYRLVCLPPTWLQTEEKQWLEVHRNRQEMEQSRCHIWLGKKETPLWKVCQVVGYRWIGGYVIHDRRRVSAESSALGWGVAGEMKTYLSASTAVAESVEVLTCSWAACQLKHLPAPLLSRGEQLESFAVSQTQTQMDA